MMAQWTLEPLLARLDRLETPTVLFAATNDKTVPPEVAQAAAAKLPNGRSELIDGLGHLAHEEDPPRVAELIRAAVADLG
jgi:magnesium chelatase accessory protein